MSNIFRFNPKNGFRVVFRGKQRRSADHRITVVVLDRRHPEDVRALVQRRIVRAASFKPFRNFIDAAARSSQKHSFRFRASRNHTARFVREIHPLLLNGLVAISIDGIDFRANALRRVA